MSFQEQRIGVWFGSEEIPEIQIEHASTLANIMRKELCFFHISKEKSAHSTVLKNMNTVKERILKEDPVQRVTVEVIEGDYEESLIKAIEDLDLLLIVFDKQKDYKILHSFSTTSVPYLFTDKNVDINKAFQNIVFSIGYIKRSKDAALWASYIARYNKTNVTLLKASDSDEDDQKIVKAHMYSVENLFEKFDFSYEIKDLGKPSWRMVNATYRKAHTLDSGLIIIALSLDNDFITRMIPYYYRRHLIRSKETPLLLINSKRDLYTMCGG